MHTYRETTYVQACSLALRSRSLAAPPDRDNAPTYNDRRGARVRRIGPTSATTSPPAAFDAHVVVSRLGAPLALCTSTGCPEDNEHARAIP